MQRRDINAADAPVPAGQYTQAVEVTGTARTLYVSGQVGVAADGSIPENAEAQSALAWRKFAGATARGRYENREPGEDNYDRVQSSRHRCSARWSCVGVGRTSAGEHAHRRRPQQCGLEGRGGRYRGRLIPADDGSIRPEGQSSC